MSDKPETRQNGRMYIDISDKLVQTNLEALKHMTRPGNVKLRNSQSKKQGEG